MISTVVFGHNPMTSAFASMSTDYHARSSNGALATTASTGVALPPPALSAAQKDLQGRRNRGGRSRPWLTF